MFRRSIQGLLAAAVVAGVSLGSASLASAASAPAIDRQSEARISTPSVQNVYWVWHHHHRYWVRDHYRHY